MLMAIDVGNTNMVFGLLDGERLVGSFRLMTDANRTSDEIGLTVCEYFRRFDLTMDQVTDIIIASVVPQVMYTLTSAIIKYFGKKPIIIDEDVSTGIRYQGDDRLGADRSVSCVAAMEKYGKPLVVLDFGTATTVDALSPDGEYLGGCILAGIRVSTDALFHQAAMLPRIELIRPASVLRIPLRRSRLVPSWGISVPSSTLSARPRRRCPAVRTPQSLLPVAWLGSLQITLISSMWWMVSSFWMVCGSSTSVIRQTKISKLGITMARRNSAGHCYASASFVSR